MPSNPYNRGPGPGTSEAIGLIAGGAGLLIGGSIYLDGHHKEHPLKQHAPVPHTKTGGHDSAGAPQESHVSKLVSVPSHEEAVAILANARPNAAPVAEVSPDGPMVLESGPNQPANGPFQTKKGNFEVLHSGQLAHGIDTAVAVEKVGDKIVTTEGP